MDYLKKSRIEEVLIAILGKGTVTSKLISRIEKILDAIRVKGSYDGIAMSEVEEILVCILLGKRFEKPTHSRIAAMLKVKANGGEYTELRKSRVEELIFEWINAVESATYKGTLPATLQTIEGYLEQYKIYGNTVQDGTPTPENPIMPSGCGVRTENLCYKIITNATIDGNGRIVYDASFDVAVAPVYQDSSYSSLNPSNVYAWFMAEPYLGSQSYNQSRNAEVLINKTSPLNGFVTVRYIKANSSNAMIVEGSTTLPYEPYGYKLPLTANGVEYPIYLNEPLCGIGTYTDSLELSTGILTRKIKKLALTGEETCNISISTVSPGAYCCSFKYSENGMTDIIYNDADMRRIPYPQYVCSHFKMKPAPSLTQNDDDFAKLRDGEIGANTARNDRITYNRYIILCSSEYTTIAGFKSYLRQQYANGTPVTVWYVLAEPEISTIPVPSGLTGTIEGYLIQDGTPTPETPIYPTANGVKQADGTYIIPYSVEYPIYLGDAQLAKDEYVDSNTGKIYRRTKNLSPPEEEWTDEWIWGDGTVHPSTQIKTSPFIDVSTCETCIMEVFSAETEWAAAGYREMAFYDENEQYLGWIGGGGRRALTPNSSERLSEFPAGTVYVRISCSHNNQPFYPQLVSGYTPTHRFYPYIVPTDPPTPFPQIPTFAGTTVIDYNGTPKPDKVELTYSKPK